MKKVGVITSSSAKNGTFGCNYGAALQGYALIKQLRILGYDAYDLNYISANEYHPNQYNLLKRTLLRAKLIFNVNLVKRKIQEHKNRDNLTIWRNKFKEFIAENDLTYEKGSFYTIEQLQEKSGDFYAFITGSDVVWNAYLHKGVNDEGFFLDFAVPGVKRIAYAASIGSQTLPETAKGNLKELLLKFDALSIREKTGADLIKSITGIEMPVVLDPTMLLNPVEYEEIVKVPEYLPDKFIAVYVFGSLPHTQKKIEELKTKLDLPLIYIPAGDLLSDQPDYRIGPGEFIGVIRKARLVITDSFHCTVFCLINHTPFYTFCRSDPRSGENINSRMIDLLKMVDAEDRMVMPGDDINYEKIDAIDFKRTDELIEEKRRESMAYLLGALNE